MGRKPNDSEPSRWVPMVLLLMGLVSCSLVYMFMSVAFRPTSDSPGLDLEGLVKEEGELSEKNGGGCCRGIEKLELWGSAVKWGTDFKFNTSEECCQACKNLCTGNDGPCLCDSWVFCGNREACGPKFGEVRINLLMLCLINLINLLHFGVYT